MHGGRDDFQRTWHQQSDDYAAAGTAVIFLPNSASEAAALVTLCA